MLALLVAAGLLSSSAPPPACEASPRWVLVAHGGAGAWSGSAAEKAKRKAVLRVALARGAAELARGANAVDTIVEVVRLLEDAPELNAGRGGKPNRAGFVELDAAIMRGRDRAAGAVAAVRDVKNPIRLAHAVMERSRHVLFVDRGASAFAKAQGIELVEPSYFLVAPSAKAPPKKSKSGTVGAVALDRCGHVAAGTSTGGYDTKSPGRVGDVPVIGAGTYADDAVAISATGWGEHFIRRVAAHDVAARMRYAKAGLRESLATTLAAIRSTDDATGGFIALTPQGTWATDHTSPGMLRGIASHQAPTPRVGIFDELD